MIHQRKKDLIFFGIKIVSLGLYPIYKIYFFRKKDLSLHLGSGRKIIKGFLNIDANPLLIFRGTLFYDILNKLPFKNNSVKEIYLSNVLEHFYFDEALKILKEIYRVLKKEGVVRIVVPDLEKSIQAYIKNDYHFFSDFPYKFQSQGGRFYNFIFCDAQHKMAFDFEFLKEILTMAGFKKENIFKVESGKSNLLEKNNLDRKSVV